MKTRLGEIAFSILQVSEGGFYPSVLEKCLRTEQALIVSLAEMYILGVSIREFKPITEQLCDADISAIQVSRYPYLIKAICMDSYFKRKSI